jgi:mRNA interferase MazF
VRRGEFYRVAHPSATDPKRYRVFVIVSRQVVIDSRFSTAICAPVYSTHDGLATQVLVGVDEGLKHDSSIHCDELVSLPKASLTHFVGTLPPEKMKALNEALRIALDINEYSSRGADQDY